MTPTITTPDQTDKAKQIISLLLATDVEARSETLARLIAACIHTGPGSPLERFAATGQLDPVPAHDELDRVTVPPDQESWADALGRYILLHSGVQS